MNAGTAAAIAALFAVAIAELTYIAVRAPPTTPDTAHPEREKPNEPHRPPQKAAQKSRARTAALKRRTDKNNRAAADTEQRRQIPADPFTHRHAAQPSRCSHLACSARIETGELIHVITATGEIFCDESYRQAHSGRDPK